MNYARFYALFNRLPVRSQDMKEQLVLQYTDNRTVSLRAMTSAEYSAMCNALEQSLKDTSCIQREELRKSRSTVLHLMQKLGIDTTDWHQINTFCQNPRIAGKLFRQLNIAELRALIPKLEAIARKDVVRSKRVSYKIVDDEESRQPAIGNSKTNLVELYLQDIDGLVRQAANQMPS